MSYLFSRNFAKSRIKSSIEIFKIVLFYFFLSLPFFLFSVLLYFIYVSSLLLLRYITFTLRYFTFRLRYFTFTLRYFYITLHYFYVTLLYFYVTLHYCYFKVTLLYLRWHFLLFMRLIVKILASACTYVRHGELYTLGELILILSFPVNGKQSAVIQKKINQIYCKQNYPN